MRFLMGVTKTPMYLEMSYIISKDPWEHVYKTCINIAKTKMVVTKIQHIKEKPIFYPTSQNIVF